MDINRESLEVLFQEFLVKYTDAFNGAAETTLIDSIAMIQESAGHSTKQAWLNQIPKMREWVGDRIVKNFESNSFDVINRLFEATIEIDRVDMEDDLHRLYLPLATAMGKNARVHPDELAFDAMVADVNWGGDLQKFYSTTRKFGTNDIVNKTDAGLSEAEVEVAFERMSSYVGHGDEPLGVVPFALVHGPTNRTLAFDILQNDLRVSGNAAIRNRNLNLVTPVQSNRFVGANKDRWFILGESAGIRGVVYQNRMEAEFQSQKMDIDSEHAFDFDSFEMGTRARGEAFLALPQLVYGGGFAP